MSPCCPLDDALRRFTADRGSYHRPGHEGGPRVPDGRCWCPIRAREPRHSGASTRSWHPGLLAGLVAARRTESSPCPLVGPAAGRCGSDVRDPADQTFEMRPCSPPWPMVAQGAALALARGIGHNVHGKRLRGPRAERPRPASRGCVTHAPRDVRTGARGCSDESSGAQDASRTSGSSQRAFS